MDSSKIRLISLIGIVSAVLICLVSLHRHYTVLTEAYAWDQQQIFLYDRDMPSLYVRPCTAEGTDDPRLFFFLPYSGRDWVWHIPEELNLYIDGIPCLSGQSFSIPDPEAPHFYSVEMDGIIFDLREIEFLQAAQVAALSVSLPPDDIDAIVNEDYPESVTSASLFLADSNAKPNCSTSCEITGHGNSTWLSSKKSFGIETEAELSLLNMGYSSKWNLIANNMDRSHIKSRIVYEASGRTGLEFSVDCEYLNLYINGIYQGLYLLTQKPFPSGGCVTFPDDLKKENSLLNGSLTEYPQLQKDIGTKDEIRFSDISLSPGDISGSYMMEFREFDKSLMPHIRDPYFYSAASTDRFGSNYLVQIRYPKIITEKEIRFIRDNVWTAEKAVYSPDGTDPDTGIYYQDLIDPYSWSMSWLFMDFFAYQDESAGSLFFYKKRRDPLLYSGPIWDYDKSMTDDFVKTDSFPPDGRINMYLWYKELGRYEDFYEKVRTNYNSELSPIMEDIISNDLPLWMDQIASSEKMDDIKWTRGDSYGENHSKEVAVWLSERKAFYDGLMK